MEGKDITFTESFGGVFCLQKENIQPTYRAGGSYEAEPQPYRSMGGSSFAAGIHPFLLFQVYFACFCQC